MNIFYLDHDPYRAAEAQCDKHVVKMVLETAQIMSTVAGGPYKPTHKSHPAVIWAGEAAENYQWLAHHGLGLCSQYLMRFGRVHKSARVILDLFSHSNNLPSGSTEVRQCMPDQYKVEGDPVRAYRAYYLGDKMRFARWKLGAPKWVRQAKLDI